MDRLLVEVVDRLPAGAAARPVDGRAHAARALTGVGQIGRGPFAAGDAVAQVDGHLGPPVSRTTAAAAWIVRRSAHFTHDAGSRPSRCLQGGGSRVSMASAYWVASWVARATACRFSIASTALL